MGAVDGLVFDEGEGLVVGGAVHEVGEAWGELGFEGIGEGEDVEGDLFEFFEVGSGVAVAPWVVGDDGEAFVEEGGEGSEVWVHVWDDWRKGEGRQGRGAAT